MNDTAATTAGTPDTKGAKAPDATDKKEEKKEDSLLVFILKLFVVVFIFRSFIFGSYSIPSESMLPRLWNGDYLAASKWSYGYTRYSLLFEPPLGDWRIFASEPERGDIAVFKHPVDRVDYIKRVIGLPGDQIQMIGGVLHINGTAVQQERISDFVQPVSPNTDCRRGASLGRNDAGVSACRYERFRETLPNGVSYTTLNITDEGDWDNTRVYLVPEGHVFMMGDNRDNSLDSRAPGVPGQGVGMVPMDLLLGKAQARVWSTDGSAEYLLPWTWFSAARWNRIGDGL